MDLLEKSKRKALSKTLDFLNAKYGKDTVSIGILPSISKKYHTGTKIAFVKIPDLKDFNE